MNNMEYKIPLFDLNYDKEEEEIVLRTIRSKWISMGPNVVALERTFSEHLNIKNAIAVTNCTAALHLALLVLGIKEGDEVIVPSLTFVATVNAVRYVGATPVFADITSYEDFSIDPIEIETKITDRTKAIIVMHYGGFACNMDEIMRIAKKYNLYVVEDAAHALSAEYKGRKLGTFGDIGCFSFFSNKNITCAEGGILVTDNDDYTRKARLLRAHGMTTLSYDRAKGHATDYDLIGLGYNYRMDDIRGSLALVQLGKLKTDIDKRAELRKYYCDNLMQIDEIIIPYEEFEHKSSNYIFPILLKNGNVEKRNIVRQRLAEAGIQTSVHYPAVHKFSIYQQYEANLPKTDYVSVNEITLPMYYSLQVKEVHYICSTLRNIIRGI